MSRHGSAAGNASADGASDRVQGLLDEQGCLAVLMNRLHPNVVELLHHFMDEVSGHAALVTPAGLCDLRGFQHLAQRELPIKSMI